MKPTIATLIGASLCTDLSDAENSIKAVEAAHE